MASWTADDGSIDINAPKRPGIINFYLVHSVKINGEFFQHAFAVVWWFKTDHDRGYMFMNLLDQLFLCLCSE